MNTFDESVIAAVTGHMNGDHPEDNLLIARAFGAEGVTASEMVGLDSRGGVWRVTEGDETRELRIEWPGGEITERPEIRHEVVLLYREACKRLGVTPREEEKPAQPHGHPHGHPHGGAAADAADGSGEKPFSQVIREGSWSDHDSSEGADFMASIMRGQASLQDYADLVAQHFFMYEALEAVADEFAADPQFAPFHEPALARMEALDADLTKLFGENWRETISPVPACREYAERIREIGAEGWVPGLVAHHYTRYLGDLSGGQMIAKRVTRQHEFADGKGAEFYDFTSLGPIPHFKERYRAALDALGPQLSEEEQARMLEEVRRAYAFNTAVFVDLAHAKAGANA